MASKKLSLNASELRVVSFTAEDPANAAGAQDQMVEGDTTTPYCIVYVSDCVECT
jgi:hypothetical protein